MRSIARNRLAPLVLLLLLGLVANVFAQYSCESGSCVVIQQCPKLFKILTTFPRDVQGYDLLKSRNCGYEKRYPKVCCTPDEKVDDQSPNPNQNNNNANNNNNPNVNRQNNNNNNNNDNNNNKPAPNVPKESDTDYTEARKLLPADCGRDLSNRIVGGEVTELTEFPWMALLEYRKPNGKTTACGGVLISKRYILTAAHCLKGKALPTSWKLNGVRLGEYNTATAQDCIPDGETDVVCADDPITVGIEEQIVHEEYQPDSTSQHHDIALIRLAQDVAFSNYIKPICLPSGPKLNAKMVVAGWGKTESKSESEIKLKVSLPLVQLDFCSSQYKRTMVSSQICAGGERGKDSCRGDSGGPLMQQQRRPNDNNLIRWETVGVVSFGPTPCGTPGYPGVYSNVNHYVPWILSKMKA